MTTKKFDIRTALMNTVFNAGLTYPVKYPNGSFYTGTTLSAQPDNSPWLRVTDLPSQPIQRSMGNSGNDIQVGVLQISIFVPIGSGDIKALQIADEIETIIYAGAVLTYNAESVRITSVGVQQGTIETAWYSQILNIEYYAYLQRGI